MARQAPPFEKVVKKKGLDTADLRALSARETLNQLHSLLRMLEGQGYGVNWRNLSLYHPESARALLSGLVDAKLRPWIWNGISTEEHPTCMAGGVRLFLDPLYIGYHCTCSLISPTAAVTADHCVVGSERMSWINPRTVVDGVDDWKAAEVVWRGRVVGSERELGRRRADLAVVRLEGDGFLKPDVFSHLASDDLFGRASQAMIVGYGPAGRDSRSAGVRRMGIVQPIWETVIRRPYGGVVAFDPETEFVCGVGLSSQDALPGDSGAPIYLWDEGTEEWRIAGVLSRGAGLHTDLGAGAVYTKLRPFLTEIESKVGPLRIRAAGERVGDTAARAQ